MDAEEIKRMIDRLWGNTRRPLSDSRGDLRDIRDHIDMLLDASSEADGDDGDD